MKNLTPWGCLPLPRSYIYMYMTTNFKALFSKTAWPIKANFYVEPPWEGGMKVYINDTGRISKMATTPIYGKTFKKSSPTEQILLWSWTWRGALWTQALHSLYKWWPWVDLDLFYAMSNLAKLFFCTNSCLRPDIRWAFTGPLVLWFIYMLHCTFII